MNRRTKDDHVEVNVGTKRLHSGISNGFCFSIHSLFFKAIFPFKFKLSLTRERHIYFHHLLYRLIAHINESKEKSFFLDLTLVKQLSRGFFFSIIIRFYQQIELNFEKA